jgi:hypothetical protein
MPEALAVLRAGGGPPSAAQVELERARAERLVTRGSRRAWRRYLGEAFALASSSEDPAVAEARAVVEDVVRNHNNLELAI